MSDVTNDIYWYTCGKPVGSPPWWMSEDQFDPCKCILSPGHERWCECEHTIDTSELEGTPDE